MGGQARPSRASAGFLRRTKPDGADMRYELNPKHKEPWQRGRKGSLCPEMPEHLAQELLNESVEYGRKRYACHEGRAFCAQEHRSDRWHGYPVSWNEVPPKLKNAWILEGKVTRRQTKHERDQQQ